MPLRASREKKIRPRMSVTMKSLTAVNCTPGNFTPLAIPTTVRSRRPDISDAQEPEAAVNNTLATNLSTLTRRLGPLVTGTVRRSGFRCGCPPASLPG